MNKIGRGVTLVLIMAALVVCVGSSQVQAIANGFPDTSNTFSNVGALIAVGPDGTGYQLCSGTLIAPTVFLTAAHCVHFFNDFLGPQGFTLYMSFGNPIPILELTDVSTLIPVNEIIPNPKYVQATDTHPFNPHHGSDPGDLAVVILPLLSTRGITPAILPTLGLLDQLAAKNALHDAVFIAVGYGAEDRFGTQLNPVPRQFAFSSFNALEVGYLQLSINPTLNNGGDSSG